jgi:hypothetical protein
MALHAQSCGVDRVMVDLERLGKQERQGKLDTVQSAHTLEDLRRVRDVLTTTELQVRVNPLHPRSEEELERVLDYAPDVVMLPMFDGANEARAFIDLLDGRARACLLLETPGALADVEAVVDVAAGGEIYVGLNDLHLALGLSFMFELLSNGVVEGVTRRCSDRGVPVGFGGISRMGAGTLDSRLVLAEHRRLGSTSVILSRDFHRRATSVEELIANSFDLEVDRLRREWNRLAHVSADELSRNHDVMVAEVDRIVGRSHRVG